MPDSALSLAVCWADQDLLDIEIRVALKEWTGTDTAYAVRDDFRTFAASLDEVAANGSVAVLDIGQPDLGYANCRVFEYGGPRHLGIDVVLGRAGSATGRDADPGRVLQLSVPVERGQLATFANDIRRIVEHETGIAVLQLPPDWP